MLSIGCLNDNCILACYDDFFIHKMSVRIYRYCFADPAGRRSSGQFITEIFQRFRRRLGGDYFCLGICRHVWGICGRSLLGSSPESGFVYRFGVGSYFSLGLCTCLYYSAIGRWIFGSCSGLCFL